VCTTSFRSKLVPAAARSLAHPAPSFHTPWNLYSFPSLPRHTSQHLFVPCLLLMTNRCLWLLPYAPVFSPFATISFFLVNFLDLFLLFHLFVFVYILIYYCVSIPTYLLPYLFCFFPSTSLPPKDRYVFSGLVQSV
jgi:hypothetical protein